MITSLYAGVLAMLIAWLSIQVIKLRRSHRIALGDGGEPKLQNAIRAHGNATEYVPFSLILLLLVELSDAAALLVHAAGIALVAGRILHARGLLTEDLKQRVLGMKLTLFTLIGLAMANIGYALLKLI